MTKVDVNNGGGGGLQMLTEVAKREGGDWLMSIVNGPEIPSEGFL